MVYMTFSNAIAEVLIMDSWYEYFWLFYGVALLIIPSLFTTLY